MLGTPRHYFGSQPPKCTDCRRVMREDELEEYWTRVLIGGDAYALQCPECNDKELEEGAKDD